MKKQELKKLIKENITDWLSERSQQNEANSGDMAYTEKTPVKEKVVKIEDQIAEFYYVTKPTKESSVEELIKSGDVFEFAMSGLTREDISGIYKSEGRAKSAANKDSFVDDYEQAVEAFINNKGETYMSEAGHAENWSKAEVNPEVIKALKDNIKKLRELEL